MSLLLLKWITNLVCRLFPSEIGGKSVQSLKKKVVEKLFSLVFLMKTYFFEKTKAVGKYLKIGLLFSMSSVFLVSTVRPCLTPPIGHRLLWSGRLPMWPMWWTLASELSPTQLWPQMDLKRLSTVLLICVFAGAAAKDDERLPNRCEGGTKSVKRPGGGACFCTELVVFVFSCVSL